MLDIIVKKPYERFNWREKISSLGVKESMDWQRKEYLHCVDDKPYWFKQYIWTMNTEKNPPIVPFILYDYQEKFIYELDKFQDIFVEKSRQMGISWTIMGWELHKACYTKGFSALNISRKESEVQDKGNTFHALMGRLYFMWQRLPPFLQPKINNPFLTFNVLSMNSIIKGESSNKNAGRDTNYKFILVDEAGHIQVLDDMWKAVRQSSNAICVNSTPPKEIVNSKYMELKDKKNSGFKKLKFHWSQHPEKDQDWFERKTASMEDTDIAQELEIGYDKAQTNKSYPEYNEQIHLAGHKIYYNKALPLNIFMDFGLDGEVFLFSQIDHDDRMFIIKYKIYRNLLTYELYKKLCDDLHDLGFRGKIEDIRFIGDTAGNKRSRQTKTSVIQEYYKVSNGKVNILSQTMSNDNKMLSVRHSLKRLIDGRPQITVSKEDSCLRFSECMKYMTLNKKKEDHVDNKYTHAVNAFEYGVNHFFPHEISSAAMVGTDPSDEGDILINGDKKGKVITYIDDFEEQVSEEAAKKESCLISPVAVIGGHKNINEAIDNSSRIKRRSLIWQ